MVRGVIERIHTGVRKKCLWFLCLQDNTKATVHTTKGQTRVQLKPREEAGGSQQVSSKEEAAQPKLQI